MRPKFILCLEQRVSVWSQHILLSYPLDWHTGIWIRGACQWVYLRWIFIMRIYVQQCEICFIPPDGKQRFGLYLDSLELLVAVKLLILNQSDQMCDEYRYWLLVVGLVAAGCVESPSETNVSLKYIYYYIWEWKKFIHVV